jgi:hypothetical protein
MINTSIMNTVRRFQGNYGKNTMRKFLDPLLYLNNEVWIAFHPNNYRVTQVDEYGVHI